MQKLSRQPSSTAGPQVFIPTWWLQVHGLMQKPYRRIVFLACTATPNRVEKETSVTGKNLQNYRINLHTLQDFLACSLFYPVRRCSVCYSRVRNKHSPTLINFLTYSGLHRAYFSSISIRYKWGYAYSFCQIFQGLRLFKGLCLFQTLEQLVYELVKGKCR